MFLLLSIGLVFVSIFCIEHPCTDPKDQILSIDATTSYCYRNWGRCNHNYPALQQNCTNWFHKAHPIAVHSDAERDFVYNNILGATHSIWAGLLKLDFHTSCAPGTPADFRWDDETDTDEAYITSASVTKDCSLTFEWCFYIDTDQTWYDATCGIVDDNRESVCYFKIPICNNINATDTENVCNGHGYCLEDDKCSCERYYEGNDCESTHKCNGIRQDNPSVCNSKGNCTSTENCVCYGGYDGNYCQNWNDGLCTNPGEFMYDGVCYKNFGGGRNFEESESYCQTQWSNFTGSHLISIHNFLPLQFVENNIISSKMWLGLKKNNSNSSVDLHPCPPEDGYHWTDDTDDFYAISRGVSIGCDDDNLCIALIQGDYFWRDENCTDNTNFETGCMHAIPRCKGVLSNEEELVCSGHGRCIGTDNCTCFDGYFGEFCDFYECFGIQMDSSSACQGHGSCDGPDYCECDDDYYDIDCNLTSCAGIESTDPTVCLERGKCKTKDSCICDWDYGGSNCEVYYPCQNDSLALYYNDSIVFGTSLGFGDYCYQVFRTGQKSHEECQEACTEWYPYGYMFGVGDINDVNILTSVRATLGPGNANDLEIGLVKNEYEDCPDGVTDLCVGGWHNHDPHLNDTYINYAKGIDFTFGSDEVSKCIRKNVGGGWFDHNCAMLLHYICRYYLHWCNGIREEDRSVCNNNGFCLQNEMCTCKGEGYVLPYCELFYCDGIPGNETEIVCSGHGLCSSTDECSCDEGWFGSGSVCNVTSCGGYFTNDTSAETLASVCNGHGTCKAYETCDCDDFYFGGECQKTYCNWIKSDDPSVCSGRGSECYPRDNCTCVSSDYWGEDCEISMCFGIPSDDPNVCSGGGECVDTDTCKCQEGYYFGEKCNITLCNSIMSNETDVCTTKGTCWPYQTCTCDSQYYFGEGDCDKTSCFNYYMHDSRVCNGHGECWPHDICHCNTSYYGAKCDITTCNGNWSNSSHVCSNHGECIALDVCDCAPKTVYFGQYCQIEWDGTWAAQFMYEDNCTYRAGYVTEFGLFQLKDGDCYTDRTISRWATFNETHLNFDQYGTVNCTGPVILKDQYIPFNVCETDTSYMDEYFKVTDFKIFRDMFEEYDDTFISMLRFDSSAEDMYTCDSDDEPIQRLYEVRKCVEFNGMYIRYDIEPSSCTLNTIRVRNYTDDKCTSESNLDIYFSPGLCTKSPFEDDVYIQMGYIYEDKICFPSVYPSISDCSECMDVCFGTFRYDPLVCNGHGTCHDTNLCECNGDFYGSKCTLTAQMDVMIPISGEFGIAAPPPVSLVDGEFAMVNTPSGRERASSTVLGDVMYYYGGVGKVGCRSNDLWGFNMATEQWCLIEGDPTDCNCTEDADNPQCRDSAIMFTGMLNHTILLFGGGNETDTFGDLWEYNLLSKAWTKLRTHQTQNFGDPMEYGANTGPGRLTLSTVQKFNSTLSIIFAGKIDDSNAYSHLWEYNRQRNEFRYINQNGASKPSNLAGINSGQKDFQANNYPGSRTGPVSWIQSSLGLWIMGGKGHNGRYWRDFWAYRFEDMKWAWMFQNDEDQTAIFDKPKEMGSYVMATMEGACAWSVDNFAFIFGGRDHLGGYYADVWMYDIKMFEGGYIYGSLTPNEVVDEDYVPTGYRLNTRYFPSCGISEARRSVFIVGGSGTVKYMNDVWKYIYSEVHSCFGYHQHHEDVCSQKGLCVAENKCDCKSSYGGRDCSIPKCYGTPSDVSSVCSGHGKCTAVDTCECDPEYFDGQVCSNPICFGILAGKPGICSDHGTCIHPDTCVCESSQYKGSQCEVFTCFGLSKNETDFVCSGHGNCTALDTCSCEGSYDDGKDCSIPVCSSLLATDPGVCNGNGVCISPETCICDYTQYHGKYCGSPRCGGIKNTDENVCNGHGTCGAVNTCSCENEWDDGDKCTTPKCFGLLASNNLVCSGNGTCIDVDLCKCFDNYDGVNCSEITCFGISEKEIDFVCSGHGKCVGIDKCECFPEYNDGKSCKLPVCFGDLSTSSSVCNHQNGTCVAPDVCLCNNNYHGSQCDLPNCYGISSDEQNVCNGHGNCINLDVCNCTLEYDGAKCSSPVCFGKSPISDPLEVCSGNGTCINPDICVCDEDHFGENCDIPKCFGIDRDDGNVCNGFGICVAVNNCSCDSQHNGINCQYPICFSYSSSDPEVCSSNGTCLQADFCVCDKDHHGSKCELPKCHGVDSTDSNVCNGHSCIDVDTCDCSLVLTPAKYGGDRCQYPICNGYISTLSSSACNGNGTCVAPDTCVCQDNYAGKACEYVTCFGISSAETDSVCNGNGDCIGIDKCECLPEYGDSVCSKSTCGGKVAGSSEVCNNGNGTCVYPNVCLCNDLWEGPSCETKKPPKCFGILDSDPTRCNGHGNCIDLNTCNCTSDWDDGIECKFPVCSGRAGNDPASCSGNGTCIRPGICLCDDNHFGENCDIPKCFGIDKDDGNVCNGFGICVAVNNCSCDSQHNGEQCQYPICFSYSSSDPEVCSSNGTCISPNLCDCDKDHHGSNCELPKCYGADSTDANTCKGRGNCIDVNTCDCSSEYSGSRCQYPVCNNIPSSDTNSVCSGNGTCIAPNLCLCNDDYDGLNCEFITCFGISEKETDFVCSGNGNCVGIDICECNSKFSGSSCNIPKCKDIPATDSEVCNHGNGTCVYPDLCICLNNDKYHGINCDMPKCYGIPSIDGNVCSGNGECLDVDLCNCTYKYGDSVCSTPICNSILATDSSVCSGNGTVSFFARNTEYCGSYKIDRNQDSKFKLFAHVVKNNCSYGIKLSIENGSVQEEEKKKYIDILKNKGILKETKKT